MNLNEIYKKEKIINAHFRKKYNYESEDIFNKQVLELLCELSEFAYETKCFKYWKDENRHPYILKCNGELAGFVLQRYNENNYNEIAEFFVLNKYRKLGAGTFMAKEIFKKYRGKWEIRTLLKNKRGQEFWRKIVKEVSNGEYIEQLIRNNSRYAFYFES